LELGYEAPSHSFLLSLWRRGLGGFRSWLP
jgi:hypothetical protein